MIYLYVMKKSVRKQLLQHFEGVAELQSQYLRLDSKLTKVTNCYNFHCKEKCGKCCLGSAENKEATVFEMLPMAIDLLDRGLADEKLKMMLETADCSKIMCVNYANDDESLGYGHCTQYALRPFVCRLFGESLYHVKGDKLEMTGCLWLKESFNSNPNKVELLKHLPVMGDTVLRGRELSELDLLEIKDINSALRDALELVCVKYDLLNGKMENED